jgi:hypothetical protein
LPSCSAAWNRSNLWRHLPEGTLLALDPTIKPVALVADAILDCTVRGIVLDLFLGSGTTVIAAERTGRPATAPAGIPRTLTPSSRDPAGNASLSG